MEHVGVPSPLRLRRGADALDLCYAVVMAEWRRGCRAQVWETSRACRGPAVMMACFVIPVVFEQRNLAPRVFVAEVPAPRPAL